MIEARRLHILRAVADHRTVTAAAAALYLTPSAVSQQLTALEQETGHRLVERGAKGVRLTPAGEILLSHTNAVLAQLERADAVVPVAHRLAGADVVPLAELAKDTWIGPYPGNPCHDVVVLACESAGFQPRLDHSSDDFRAVVALASADAGVALVPRSALRGMDLTGVVVRPVDGVAPTRRVFAAGRRGAEEHPLISPVLDALGAAARE